jgi:flagellar FliJ protein
MNAFRFRLEKVLELRKESEQRSAAGLAQARTQADDARRAKSDLEAACDAGRSRLAVAHGAGGAVGHLQNLANVVRHIEDHIHDADDVCQQADEQVVESLKSYHQAFQQRRSIEELRERKLDEWRTNVVRDERKSMDEAALVRHGRAEHGLARGK